MPSDLESRFHSFITSLPHAESIDSLLAGPEFNGEKRADYLVFDRRVIIELKSLEIDTSPKVEKELASHRDRDDFPLIYGEVELQKVLKHLPDGEQINQRIFNNTTRSIEDGARSAAKQLQNTARLLGLPDAIRVLVLLNQDIDILAPDAAVARLSPLMCRTDAAGNTTSTIDFAWLIFESHSIAEGPAAVNMPTILLEGPRAPDMPWFIDMFERLQAAWAKFNKHPLVRTSAESFTELTVSSTASRKAPSGDQRLTRQEYWEQRYAQHPYLRTLSDAQVLEKGAAAISALTPYFLVGGPRLPPEQLEPLMVAWSDFLCEGRYRGLDLRKLPKA